MCVPAIPVVQAAKVVESAVREGVAVLPQEVVT